MPQLDRRTLRLDTGKREVDMPVDLLGRERWKATLDHRSVERRGDGQDIGFKGHAAMFNKRTWIGPKKWGFWEQVSKGAFSKTLKEADVRFLVNHDPNLLLARNKAGTLTLTEDKEGLATEADMAPVSYAQDLAVLLERGDISQMSFAFETVKDTWEVLDDGDELRTLEEVRLWDVSVVTYPAYDDTDASLRSVAFSEFCRRARLVESDVIRVLDGTDEHLAPYLRAAAAAMEAEGKPGEPATTTRPSEGQPAETTGDPLQTRRLRLELAARMGDLTLT